MAVEAQASRGGITETTVGRARVPEASFGVGVTEARAGLIMRRLVPPLAVLAALACEAGVSGTCDLVSIDDQALPFTFELFGTVTVTSGAPTLSDSTYELAFRVSYGDGDLERLTETGTFPLGGGRSRGSVRIRGPLSPRRHVGR